MRTGQCIDVMGARRLYVLGRKLEVIHSFFLLHHFFMFSQCGCFLEQFFFPYSEDVNLIKSLFLGCQGEQDYSTLSCSFHHSIPFILS